MLYLVPYATAQVLTLMNQAKWYIYLWLMFSVDCFFPTQEDPDTAKYLCHMCRLQQKFYKSNKNTLK